MKNKYGDMIVLQTYPDNFTKEQETTIANTLSLAADPDVKAIIFVQAVPGASAALYKNDINTHIFITPTGYRAPTTILSYQSTKKAAKQNMLARKK